MSLVALSLAAQENRRVIANPAPNYPDVAKRVRLIGVVKAQVLISADEQIKEVRVLGGHPVLVNEVQETLKNWKYAPASNATTKSLEFTFHP
jgi:outer membrane biosynthesis protein TonB